MFGGVAASIYGIGEFRVRASRQIINLKQSKTNTIKTLKIISAKSRIAEFEAQIQARRVGQLDG